MRNLLTIHVPACILATMIFSFFGCQKQPDSVAEMSILEAQQKEEVVMNDSLWREDSIKIEELYELAWDNFNYGKSDSFRINIEDMHNLATRMNDYRDDSLSYFLKWDYFCALGNVYQWQGKIDEAIKSMTLGIEMLRKRFGDNFVRLTEEYNGLAAMYANKGDVEKAIECFQKSLHIEREVLGEKHFYVGQNLRGIGSMYAQMGETEKAFNYYNKAVQNYGTSLPLFVTVTYRKMCKLLMKEEREDEAKKLLNKTEMMVDSLYQISPAEYKWGKINYQLPIFWDWADILLKDGNSKSSIKYIDKIMEAAKSNSRFQIYMGEAYKLYGDAFRLDNDFEKALLNYQLALEELQKIQLPGQISIIETKMAIADLYRTKGEPEKALDIYQEILSTIVPNFSSNTTTENPALYLIPNYPILLDIFLAKARCYLSNQTDYHDLNKLNLAMETIEFADSLSEKFRKNYRRNNSKIQAVKKAAQIHEFGSQLAFLKFQKTGNKQFANQSWQFAEKHKSVVLLESLRDEIGKSFFDISAEMLEFERQLKTDISFYEKSIFEEEQKEQPDSNKVSYWHFRLFDIKESYDSLLTVMEGNYPNYYRLKYENPIVTVQDLKNELEDDETLLEYFLGDSTLFTFTVDRSGLEVYRQKIDSNFFHALDRLRVFSKNPSIDATWTTDYQQFVRDSRYLCGILLDSTLAKTDQTFALEKRHSLLIVPDGVLNFLPFNLLLTRQPDAATLAHYDYRNLPYLLRDFDIRYEYSATLMLESKRLKPADFWRKLWRKQPTYCGFAPSYGDGKPIASRGEMDSLKLAELYPDLQRGELHSLKFNIPEVETASQFMQGKAFTGRAATEAEFKRQAKKTGILHLAMHALTNDRDPLFSQLAFERDLLDTSEDGRLHAYELYNMRLHADLAVLSACNTGAGKLQRGEGVMSLSRAFKYAGCANVVMSLWTVSDEATKTIIGSFFRQLKDGKGKDEALCQAQRDFVGSAAQKFTHPYYWSTLVLIGDSDPLWKSGVPGIAWVVGVLVLLGLLTWNWNWRSKSSPF